MPRRRRPCASCSASTPSDSATTVCCSRAVGSGASGSPPCARIIRRQTSIARPSSSAAATSSSGRPPSASISAASATVSSRTSAGPPPASTSTLSSTSIALPLVSPSGTDMSVSSATVSTPASVPSSTIVRASSSAFAYSRMKAPEPNFTSSTRAPRALGDLLRHDARRDQRDRLDGAGGVAERVEPLVGGGQVAAGRADRRAHVGQLRPQRRRVEVRPPAGDRLQLVERAAGVAEAAAGELRHRDAERRDERRERQGDLVADAAGGVLVDRRPAEPLERHPLPGVDHREGEVADLPPVHAVQQHRHRPGGHLLVGDDAARVRVHSQRIAAVSSARPSRLATMTSMASNGSVTAPRYRSVSR